MNSVNRSRDSSGCKQRPRGMDGVEHDPVIPRQERAVRALRTTGASSTERAGSNFGPGWKRNVAEELEAGI